MGLLGPIALPWLDRWWRVLLVALVLSGCIETAQLGSRSGSPPTCDDVMLNALGALLGYWLLLPDPDAAQRRVSRSSAPTDSVARVGRRSPASPPAFDALWFPVLGEPAGGLLDQRVGRSRSDICRMSSIGRSRWYSLNSNSGPQRRASYGQASAQMPQKMQRLMSSW